MKFVFLKSIVLLINITMDQLTLNVSLTVLLVVDLLPHSALPVLDHYSYKMDNVNLTVESISSKEPIINAKVVIPIV